MLSRFDGACLRLVLLSSIFPLFSVAQDATTTAAASPTAPAVLAPQCAQTCIQNSQHVQTNCGETDQACLCQHSAIIQAAISSCLAGSKTCSDSDQQAAIAYYPQFCASYGLSSDAAAVTGANGIITAAGQAPTQVAGAASNGLVLTNTANGFLATGTGAIQGSRHHSGTGLPVPAIIGITLGIFLAVVAIAAIVVYTHVRRRQMRRRTRIEFLTSEFGDHLAEQGSPGVPRPPRSQSIKSHFMVQPTPPEKPNNEFDFGLSISRTSTLVSVAPPPPAKVNKNKDLPDLRASAYHVEHAATAQAERGSNGHNTSAVTAPRSSSLKGFIGNSGKRLRASFIGSRSNSTTKKSKGETISVDGSHYSEKDEFDADNKV